MKAFVDDTPPDAYEKLVDRLARLAAPTASGWPCHWLDLVRYADTVGYHSDQNQNACPYRDYVIQAFNANKPFDRFTVEQIAGDLLCPTPSEGRRHGLQPAEHGDARAAPKEYLAKYAADRVRTVARRGSARRWAAASATTTSSTRSPTGVLPARRLLRRRAEAVARVHGLQLHAQPRPRRLQQRVQPFPPEKDR